LGPSNLNSLKHIENKINCYRDFGLKPHEYYECFVTVEGQREADSKELVQKYEVIEEDFKLCNESCKNGMPDQMKACNVACN